MEKKQKLSVQLQEASQSKCDIEITQLSNARLKNGSVHPVSLSYAEVYIDTHKITSAKTHTSLYPVFIRDPNKAIRHCEATAAVITESIRDVQTPQIPFLWESYWKGQKTNGYFGSSDSWRCTFIHLPQITQRRLQLWCANKPKSNIQQK